MEKVNKYDRDYKVKSALDKLQLVNVGSELHGASAIDMANESIRQTALGVSRLEQYENLAGMNQLFSGYEADIYDMLGDVGAAEAFATDTLADYMLDYNLPSCDELCGQDSECLQQCEENIGMSPELWG